MATKAEYLSALDARPEILGREDPEFVDEIGGLKLYQMVISEINDGRKSAIRKTTQFYVHDEGLPTEEAFAFRKEFEKELSSAEQFVDTALDWIYKQGHADVAEIKMIDNKRLKVIATLHKTTTAPAYETKTAIIWKSNGSPVQIRFLA